MEETKERIKSIWELVGQMDEEGADMFSVAVQSLKVGFQLGMDAARKQEDAENKKKNPDGWEDRQGGMG